jgi:hypothetical protein
VQTESKTCRFLAEMTLSAVRKNPQEPAQTHGSSQKKANPEGLVFLLLVVGRNHCANSPRVAPAGLIYFLQTIPNSAPSPNGNASIEYVQLYRIADGGSIP